MPGFYGAATARTPDCADVFTLQRRMVANESETEIKIIFLNRLKNHRGQREHRDKTTTLCELCVLCGYMRLPVLFSR